MRIIKTHPYLGIIDHSVVSFAVPFNLNYLWGFGSLAGFCLIIQIVSGILLAMHYTPNINYAFLSVEHIMRDVNYGWFLRYLHSNGASMFFIVVYLHMARGIYFGSFLPPRQYGWSLGVIIFLLMMATAFMGYVLPWGQMSYWGATVITNLFSAIPFIGSSIVTWLWGGFSVDNATLNRFFSFHFFLPFILLALSILHIAFLHLIGPNNPLAIPTADTIPFYPYFHFKDLFLFFIFTLFFSYFIFFNPNLLGHPDNYIPANPMVTPPHIVPEWYFLPFYAILRSIPDKLFGVLAMFASILILFLLPFLHLLSSSSPFSFLRGLSFHPFHKLFFWLFVGVTLILGWIGSQPVTQPFVSIGQFYTFLYFFYFLFLYPLSFLFDSFFFHRSL